MVIIIIGLALIVPVGKLIKDTEKEQIVIPDAQLAQDGDFGGIPNPGMDNDPNRQAKQDNDQAVTESKGWADRKSDNLTQTLQGSNSDSGDEIARGEGNSVGHSNGPSLAGLGNGEGGGDEAAFGPKGGGGGIGPKSKIFGHGSNVHSIIYVTDGSGSLVGGKDEVLRMELKKAVSALSPVQQFNVLVFQENADNGKMFWHVGTNLMMATPNNKAKSFDFVDNQYTFHGATYVIPALEEAFRERPQLIYLLTDGLFEEEGGAAVSAKLAELNKDKKVHVNTILLLQKKAEDDDPDIKQAVLGMKQMASDNGGVFELFHADDF